MRVPCAHLPLPPNGILIGIQPFLRACVCVSLYRYVMKVYCGKMADCMRIPFGMVSGSVEDGCIR